MTIGALEADGTRGGAYVFQGSNGAWAQQAEFTQGGENAEDQFGTSVSASASGDIVVVGALGNNNSTGAANVYKRRHNGRLARSAQLTATGLRPGDGFGEDVAISADGSTIAVTSGNYYPSGRNRVYIFARTSTGWVQSAELADPANEPSADHFGWDLSLSGDGSHLAVGFMEGGYANYYTRQQDGSWKLAQELDPVPGSNVQVALSSDASTLFIGEPDYAPYYLVGKVVVYTRSDGKWKKSAVLSPSPGGNLLFGWAMAVSANGSRAVIAAPGFNYPPPPNFPGAMFVFSRNTSGVWHQVSKLTASDGQTGDRLGYNGFSGGTIGLTANGTTAVIGDYVADRAYAFSASSGKPWSQAAEFTSSPHYPGSNAVGFSDDISANGSAIVVGAPDTANNSGVVYIYSPGSKGWKLAQALIDP